ncbi:MAG: helix-turn-helix domain-containing protein [Chitinophagaceae bacterium]
MFHNWQEPHHNIKPKGFTRGFHIELAQKWFSDFTFSSDNLQGSFLIENPDIKFLFYKIFKETKAEDALTSLSIETLVLQALAKMVDKTTSSLKGIPAWVNIIKDVLHTSFYTNLSLENLAKTAAIHPVHLSRYFPKYFYCNIGEYIRKLRVEKSLSLLPNKKISLTDITFECGFCDQSHFTRCFKEINGLTPSAYRKILFD